MRLRHLQSKYCAYSKLCPESARRCQRISWKRCTAHPSLTIRSPARIRCSNTTRSCSASRRATVTCLRSSRRVHLFRPFSCAKGATTPQAFWDATGKLWAHGNLAGKYAGVFVSTSSAGGGQEMTPLTFMSTLVHQGMIFVPLGYATGFAQLVSLEQSHGGK